MFGKHDTNKFNKSTKVSVKSHYNDSSLQKISSNNLSIAHPDLNYESSSHEIDANKTLNQKNKERYNLERKKEGSVSRKRTSTVSDYFDSDFLDIKSKKQCSLKEELNEDLKLEHKKEISRAASKRYRAKRTQTKQEYDKIYKKIDAENNKLHEVVTETKRLIKSIVSVMMKNECFDTLKQSIENEKLDYAINSINELINFQADDYDNIQLNSSEISPILSYFNDPNNYDINMGMIELRELDFGQNEISENKFQELFQNDANNNNINNSESFFNVSLLEQSLNLTNFENVLSY